MLILTDWHLYDFDYEKLEYDIQLQDGTIITNCYPNAGKFMCLAKGKLNNKSWSEKEVYMIRITPKENQILFINDDEVYK